MLTIIDTLFEYLFLLAKRDRLGIPLDEVERMRVRQIGDAFRAEASDRESRTDRRIPIAHVVELTARGAFAEARLCDLSAGGLRIRTQADLSVGSAALVRIAVTSLGQEYVFPTRVVWTSRTAQGDFFCGLAFDGTPARARVRRSGSYQVDPVTGQVMRVA